MIYAIYHTMTDTQMSENGVPGWVDVLGGMLDMVIIAALAYGVSVLR